MQYLQSTSQILSNPPVYLASLLHVREQAMKFPPALFQRTPGDQIVEIGFQRRWGLVDSKSEHEGQSSWNLPFFKQTEGLEEEHILVRRVIREVQFPAQYGNALDANHVLARPHVWDDRPFEGGTFDEALGERLPLCWRGEQISDHLQDGTCSDRRTITPAGDHPCLTWRCLRYVTRYHKNYTFLVRERATLSYLATLVRRAGKNKSYWCLVWRLETTPL